MLFRHLFWIVASVLIWGTMAVAERNLVVVNGLGETLDLINLSDSAVTPGVDQLGLYPNDFVVSGDRGIAINSGSNDLYFYDMTTLARVGQLFVGAGRNPYNGAFLNADTFYVTNLVASSVTKVDAGNRAVITEFPVGDNLDSDSPQGIVIRDRRAYISLTSFNELFEYDQGKLEVWDLNADTLIKRVAVGVNPQLARFGYDGYLYILCTGNYADIGGRLFKFDPATLNLSDSLDIGGSPGGLAITKSGVAFLAAGGWPPPVKLDVGGLQLVGRWLAKVQLSGGLVFTVDLASWSLQHGPLNPVNTCWGVTSATAITDSTVAVCCFADDRVVEIDAEGIILKSFDVGDGPAVAAKSPDCYVPKGDADNSGAVSISDAVYLINFIFAGGPEPQAGGSGDADCSGSLSISDAVYLINFIFAGGPPPCGCAD